MIFLILARSVQKQRVGGKSLLLPSNFLFLCKIFLPAFRERREGRGERKVNFCGSKIKLNRNFSLAVLSLEIILIRI